MRLYDVTRPLSANMLVFPGDIRPTFKQRDAGQYLISDLHMSSHTGTHIDAPAHYLKSGDTIDTIDISNLIGRCCVLDLSDAEELITVDCLKGKIGKCERLFLKTAFSNESQFREDYPSLSADAARFITTNGLKCVGIDSPSIESFNCDGSVHRELLGRGCIIIELLDLSQVSEGDYWMIALPLRLTGLDGSPARILLHTLEEE